MSERVNIFDIAKEAGVSIATVSRVISGSAQVRPETRERVMRIVEKYNFKPSMIATGLSQRKSRTLGMVLPLIDNPFYTQLCLAAQMEAQRMNYSVMLYQQERNTILSQDFMDMLIGKRLDGVVFSGDVATDGNDGLVTEYIAQIRRYTPVVIINPSEPAPCPCLYSDLSGSMRMALGHLNRLGHRRIAMLGGTGSTRIENTREYAYRDEMKRLGHEEWIYPFTLGESAAGGEQCVLDLWAQQGDERRPTALVAFNDLVAIGAIKQLKRMGYQLPQDMAIVGCDNLFFAPYLDPPLTTIDLQIEDASRHAIQLLAHAQEHELFMSVQTFEPTLIVRESCGAGLTLRPASI